MKKLLILLVGMASLSCFADSAENLRELIREGDLPAIKRMINGGFDPLEYSKGRSVSVLEYSVMFNQTDILAFFIESTPNMIKLFGVNALVLSCASNKRNKEVINLLLASGVDINGKNAFDKNCLYVAALTADYDFFDYLMTKGADPSITVVPDKFFTINTPISIDQFINYRLNSYKQLQDRIRAQ